MVALREKPTNCYHLGAFLIPIQNPSYVLSLFSVFDLKETELRLSTYCYYLIFNNI